MEDMSNQYSSLSIASYIVQICEENGFNWNNTKVQKLLYCCYGCYLGAYDKRICDEYPRAWQYGPVFPRVFSYINKKKNIRDSSLEFDAPDEIKEFIKKVVCVFGKYSAQSLSNWTHEKGSPWDIVVNQMEGKNSFIPEGLIKDYFIQQKIVTPRSPCQMTT